jgi:hypothetical protein
MLDTASHLADEGHAMTAGEWEQVKAAQLAAYYRDLKDGRPSPPDDESDGKSGDGGAFGL